MKAQIGDRIAIHQTQVDVREATVIDIRDPESAQPTYLVEWADNGHRQLVALGPGSKIEKK